MDETRDYGYGFAPRRFTAIEREIEEKWDEDRVLVWQLVADWIAYQFYLRNRELFDRIRDPEDTPQFLEYKRSEEAVVKKGLARLQHCFASGHAAYTGITEIRNFLVEEQLWLDSDERQLAELHRVRPLLH